MTYVPPPLPRQQQRAAAATGSSGGGGSAVSMEPNGGEGGEGTWCGCVGVPDTKKKKKK